MILMRLSLGLSSTYHTAPSYWLELGIEELYDWAMVANRLAEEEHQRQNSQRVGR